jgi:hypothetical protein
MATHRAVASLTADVGKPVSQSTKKSGTSPGTAKERSKRAHATDADYNDPPPYNL